MTTRRYPRASDAIGESTWGMAVSRNTFDLDLPGGKHVKAKILARKGGDYKWVYAGVISLPIHGLPLPASYIDRVHEWEVC